MQTKSRLYLLLLLLLLIPLQQVVADSAKLQQTTAIALEFQAGEVPVLNLVVSGGKYYWLEKAQTGVPVLREVQLSLVSLDGATPTPIPIPNPVPTPDPTPVPTVPDGVHGLTKLMYVEGMKIPLAARAKAGQLADNYAAIATGIASSGFANINTANAELKNRNTPVIEACRNDWVPFFTAQATRLKELGDTGKMVTMPQYAEAYRAIAEGLRYIK